MKHRIIGVAATAAVLFATAVPAVSAEKVPIQGDTELDVAFAEYVRDHPGDWVGAEALVQSLGGSMTISGDDGTLTTAEEATSAFDEMRGQQPGGITPFAWPSDAYTVAVAVVTSGPLDSTVSIAGAWNYRDNFIGQGPPVDIAALLVNKTCGTWSGYTASTYRHNGTSTGLASLRSGGTGTSGPAWNIGDYVTNFMSQADNGSVAAVYNRSSCSSVDKSSIQGEFVYEGNSGGSVLSVSLGWGGFGVSYSNPGQTMTKSSGAKTVPY